MGKTLTPNLKIFTPVGYSEQLATGTGSGPGHTMVHRTAEVWSPSLANIFPLHLCIKDGPRAKLYVNKCKKKILLFSGLQGYLDSNFFRNGIFTHFGGYLFSGQNC